MRMILKKTIPHAIALFIFLALTAIYFYPSVFEGKVIQQSDSIQATGMAQELKEYYEEEGGSSAWTGSMFSGMPSYHIFIFGKPQNWLTYLEKPFKALDYLGGSMVLVALICFYILMCVMGVKRWLAIAGSIAYAFASYNLIIIAVGHITKMYVIAYMPLTLAGMFLLFRRKWLWGSVLFALGVCLSFMNSHLQITYYLALLCLIILAGYLVAELGKKEYSVVAKVLGIMAISLVLAITVNTGSLYSNYEMAQESLRGKSELTSVSTGSDEKVSSGLDMDYAFMWSYGKGELLTLMIPYAYGGASGEKLGPDSRFYKTYKGLVGQVGRDIAAPTYWGDQPGTSGPVYFGALICFLFVLGMFVIRNPIKWWLLGASVFFILLSLGRNLLWFNEFFFHYLPMYNKFRVPAMALVIPGLIFPLVGFWGIKEFLSGKIEKVRMKRYLIISTVLTGGICLLVWLLPGLFLNFTSPADAQYNQWPPQLMDALIADRRSMASSDAFRSLAFILLGSGLLFYFLFSENRERSVTLIGVAMVLLVSADMWPVAKRYLNNGHFSIQKIHDSFRKTAADEYIQKDTDPSYRVLNLSVSTFQDASTSYFHKSVGGYHAAKLGRYQELIDHRLQGEVNELRSLFRNIRSSEELQNIMQNKDIFRNTFTLNMLNTRYVIFNPDYPPLVNPYAFGNGWFVRELDIVENADQEIAALNTIDPLVTAVVDRRFEGLTATPDTTRLSNATLVMESYKPNRLLYRSEAERDQVALFSEVYYPHGWKAFIDGKRVEHYRADWLLRALNVPAGKHAIEFRFEPDNYINLTKLASITSLLLLLAFAALIAYSLWSSVKKGGSKMVEEE